MAQNNAITSYYFSGQGIVLIAARDASGNPTGFRNIGNVSNMTLAVQQSTVDHRESSTGSRAIDKRITQETQLNISLTLESFDRENLALATYGDAATVAAGSVTDEAVTARLGKTVKLAHINVSNVVITGPGATPTYVEGDNYEVNAEAGSVFIYTDATQTANSAAANISEAEALEIDYDYTAYENVNALTAARSEVWVRLEGVNTADGNSPVVVDIFKMDADPLQELALINDEFGELVLEGFALADQTKLTGSKFFNAKYVRSFTNTL